MNLETEWAGEVALRKHYDEVRARLRTPPNAVYDPGLNQANGLPKQKAEPIPLSKLEILTSEDRQKVKTYIEAYRTSFRLNNDVITIRTVLNFVAKELLLPAAAVRSRRRTKDLVMARQIAVYLTFKHTTYKNGTMAHYLGQDHSTLRHAQKTIDRIMAAGGPQAQQINDIETNMLKAFPRAALSPFYKPTVAKRSR